MGFTILNLNFWFICLQLATCKIVVRYIVVVASNVAQCRPCTLLASTELEESNQGIRHYYIMQIQEINVFSIVFFHDFCKFKFSPFQFSMLHFVHIPNSRLQSHFESLGIWTHESWLKSWPIVSCNLWIVICLSKINNHLQLHYHCEHWTLSCKLWLVCPKYTI